MKTESTLVGGGRGGGVKEEVAEPESCIPICALPSMMMGTVFQTSFVSQCSMTAGYSTEKRASIKLSQLIV